MKTHDFGRRDVRYVMCTSVVAGCLFVALVVLGVLPLVPGTKTDLTPRASAAGAAQSGPGWGFDPSQVTLNSPPSFAEAWIQCDEVPSPDDKVFSWSNPPWTFSLQPDPTTALGRYVWESRAFARARFGLLNCTVRSPAGASISVTGGFGGRLLTIEWDVWTPLKFSNTVWMECPCPVEPDTGGGAEGGAAANVWPCWPFPRPEKFSLPPLQYVGEGLAQINAVLPFEIIDPMTGAPWAEDVFVDYTITRYVFHQPNMSSGNEAIVSGTEILHGAVPFPPVSLSDPYLPPFAPWFEETLDEEGAIVVFAGQTMDVSILAEAFARMTNPAREQCTTDYATSRYRVTVELVIRLPDDPPELGCCPAAGDCYCPHSGIGCQDASCCLTVAQADSYCCAVEWDQFCADRARQMCTPIGAAAGPQQFSACGRYAAGDCFTATGDPGCTDISTCASVCLYDADCCLDEWSQDCVDLATLLSAVTGSCAGSCGSVPMIGATCSCDDLCPFFNDCCDDACAECPSLAFCPEPPPCAPPCPADVTGDGFVNIFDLLFVLSCWGALTPGCAAADVTGDGVVNIFDLLFVLSEWGPCP